VAFNVPANIIIAYCYPAHVESCTVLEMMGVSAAHIAGTEFMCDKRNSLGPRGGRMYAYTVIIQNNEEL
jgi:hypothetical protein